jgi:hypothetical protein
MEQRLQSICQRSILGRTQYRPGAHTLNATPGHRHIAVNPFIDAASAGYLQHALAIHYAPLTARIAEIELKNHCCNLMLTSPP